MLCLSLASGAGPGIFEHFYWPNKRNVCCALNRDPSDGQVCVSGYKIRLSSILSVLLPQERLLWANVNIYMPFKTTVGAKGSSQLLWVQVGKAALLCAPGRLRS